MTENEPTEEQLREFWGWCGLKAGWFKLESGLQIVAEYPSLDLNNLFKHVVPNLDYMSLIYIAASHRYRAEVRLLLSKGKNEAYSFSPKLALFWAIWEAIHAK